ncbi:GNAT family N-acetyltransferase [Cohnella nanjingensis]|uniref:GNAT family N-acetyltransferase n=1 Tax=Cohnella nanjingensis TaxID=1387779 RepID=A0A7X0RNJ7_9BACL|nr:GNAT family N-acetyltransferase [Cohnella nanjingensis]MBB6670715.1 GNAT family N-acetyltransferase [Cohnella nanjingensis]
MTEAKRSKLWMRRDDLEGLAEPVCPEGWFIRTYEAGDAPAWERIIAASFGEPISFAGKVAERPSYRPDRVFFVCRGSEPVATASALEPDEPETGETDAGYLHMVGALPACAGLGIGYAVTLAALRKMKEDGKRRALLKTDDDRLPAIRTYLKLGFMPDYREADHPMRWDAIMLRVIREGERLPRLG